MVDDCLASTFCTLSEATRIIYEQFATIALWSRDIDVYYCWMLSVLFPFFLLLCPILLWRINVSIIQPTFIHTAYHALSGVRYRSFNVCLSIHTVAYFTNKYFQMVSYMTRIQFNSHQKLKAYAHFTWIIPRFQFLHSKIIINKLTKKLLN